MSKIDPVDSWEAHAFQRFQPNSNPVAMASLYVAMDMSSETISNVGKRRDDVTASSELWYLKQPGR